MKKVKVKCRRFFEVEYEMNVNDLDYEMLLEGDSHYDADPEVDITNEAFMWFDETLSNWSLNRFAPEITEYWSDYQLETENGEIIARFDDV